MTRTVRILLASVFVLAVAPASPASALTSFPIGESAPGFAPSDWLGVGGPGQPAIPGPGFLRGRVTLVEFWTFACGNCRNVEPHVLAWRKKYGPRGLSIVGVHTPELATERVRSNVEHYVATHAIDWPVALDGEFATWRRWRQSAWPTVYLVDRHGIVRHARIGEGGYDVTERWIERLLAER